MFGSSDQTILKILLVERFPKRVQAPWSHTGYTTFGVFMPVSPVVPGCTCQFTIKNAKEKPAFL